MHNESVSQKLPKENQALSEKIKQVLFDISNAVNTTVNLDELYRSIHRSLSQIIDTTNFFIALYNKSKNTLSFPYSIDEKDGPQDEYGTDEFKLNNDHLLLTYEVIKHGKPLSFTMEQMLEYAKKEEKSIRGTPSQIWIGVPLRIKQQTIGAVVIQNYTDPERFTDNDLDILTIVSEQISFAISRKKELEALRKSEQRYRSMVENLDDIVFTRNSNAKFSYLSPAVEKITGYTQDEAQKSWNQFIHRDFI